MDSNKRALHNLLYNTVLLWSRVRNRNPCFENLCWYPPTPCDAQYRRHCRPCRPGWPARWSQISSLRCGWRWAASSCWGRAKSLDWETSHGKKDWRKESVERLDWAEGHRASHLWQVFTQEFIRQQVNLIKVNILFYPTCAEVMVGFCTWSNDKGQGRDWGRLGDLSATGKLLSVWCVQLVTEAPRASRFFGWWVFGSSAVAPNPDPSEVWNDHLSCRTYRLNKSN